LEGFSGFREALVKQWVDGSEDCADADVSAFQAALADLRNKGGGSRFNFGCWLRCLHHLHLPNELLGLRGPC